MSTYKMLIVLFCTLAVITGCAAKNVHTEYPTVNPNDAVWLNLEEPEAFTAACSSQAMGQVVISDTLREAMTCYPEETVFAVAICFAPMVSDDDVRALTAAQEMDFYNAIFEKASESCAELNIATKFAPGSCYIHRFFYAYGTAAQFQSLTCAKDVSLYIAATRQYK